MGSHKGVGRLALYVPSPMRFKKRPSAFNVCIGNELRGGSGPTEGGRYDTGWQKKFVAAAKKCGASITPSKAKRWGV